MKYSELGIQPKVIAARTKLTAYTLTVKTREITKHKYSLGKGANSGVFNAHPITAAYGPIGNLINFKITWTDGSLNYLVYV